MAGKSPATDLRKIGVFALEQLAYFAGNVTLTMMPMM